MNAKTSWQLYLLQCADGSLYTGITTDLERRLEEHNSDSMGAKYTRARRPVALVYSEPHANRSQASTREHEIKKMSRAQKIYLIQQAHKMPN
jgi:putative endonuclease